MVQKALLDALEKDPRYAKAIVSLADIRTAETKGPEAEVAAMWDGGKFTPPVYLTASVPGGRITWTSGESPRIYKLTLMQIEEAFRQMSIPKSLVSMRVVISERKKPHFKGFSFSNSSVPVLPPEGLIELDGLYWQPETLEATVRELRKARKKLKGIGLE